MEMSSKITRGLISYFYVKIGYFHGRMIFREAGMSYFKDGRYKTKPRETKCIGKVEEKLEHLCNGGRKETWCSHSKQCEAFSVHYQ